MVLLKPESPSTPASHFGVLAVGCVLALSASQARAQEWSATPLPGLPSESPMCCDSNATLFVPGGMVVGTTGSSMTSLGSYAVGWSDSGELVGPFSGGPYEIIQVVDANVRGALALGVSICPQEDGACPGVARMVREDGTTIEIVL